MQVKYNFLEKAILQFIKLKVQRWFNLEKKLMNEENFILPVELSPEKTWPDPVKIPQGGEIPFSMKNIKVIGKYLRSCISQGVYAIKSVKYNPDSPASFITPGQLKDFESFAEGLNVKHIGYTRIPRTLIFKERAIRYDNAIVLILEMDKASIASAPGLRTFKTVFKTYDSLGIVTNKLTEYLREHNFFAQASHPLGGLVLYPPLARRAGLGWLGKHGLLITPQFGARQRISAIFTSIENLPFATENEHSWIEDYCNTCNKCIRTCPPGAILKTAVTHQSQRKTHIDRTRCLPYFVEHQGCSVCLKECVFSFNDYYKIKSKFNR
jgi:Pyruvate/2-oxoacid:ferredoxin oxidoreductase delta subunit